MKKTKTSVKISEIFFSLQGETKSVGWPTVFVRLTGCPLRCTYCDTAYAFTGGQWMEIDDIVKQVEQYHPRFVTVTGGEPLAQKNCLPLLDKLCDKGYHVNLETGGMISVADVDPRVRKVIDIKTPGSGEVTKNNLENLSQLTAYDELKFVICDKADYQWSKHFVETHQLTELCDILFSPSYNQVRPADLAQWILDDRLAVRMQLQAHKVIWGEETGR